MIVVCHHTAVQLGWHNRSKPPSNTPSSAVQMRATMLLLALHAATLIFGTATLGVSAVCLEPELKAVDKEMQRLADAKLFAGMAFAAKGNKTVFSKSYGYMFPEWGVKFPKNPSNVRYHIGSNTRLFMSIAVWQQHVAGVLDVFQTIDHYLDNTDFGITEKWCPKLWNDTGSDTCIFPTIEQLLSHNSGFIDTGVHCRFPAGSWQASYCYSGPNGTDFSLNVASTFALGMYTSLGHLRAVQHVKVPLQSLPGQQFQDMTIDDVYIGAILEKKLGMPLQAILKTNVFDRAGLTSTYYDMSNRNDGVYKNFLPLPGYNSYVSPLSLSMPAMDFPNIGNLTLQSGDVADTCHHPEKKPFGTFRKLARNSLGIDSAWVQIAAGAGAIVSTFDDMHRWMRVVTREPAKLNLTQEVVKQMLTTGIPNGPFFFGQGVVTYPCTNKTLGTPWLFYVGDMGYAAIQYTELHDNPEDDLTVSFVKYTKPITDAFMFDTMSSTGKSGDPKDPLNPDNRKTVCRMSIAELDANSSVFMPQYGANGGVSVRDPSAWFTFLDEARAAGSDITKGAVPAPHIYCDAASVFPPGIDYYYVSRIVSALLGHSWLQRTC